MYGTVVFTIYKLKVTPISTVTAVQQDPFMLFYTLDEGTFIDGEAQEFNYINRWKNYSPYISS